MAARPKILFVVEGRKTERMLVCRMAEMFGISADVYSVNANIYALYQKVKDDPFALTLEVLSEMQNSESDKAVLSQEYTDVFLIFDCDAQHTLDREEHKRLSARQVALRDLGIVQRMAERFDESTDPQKGKLLVNYPMVESFRDADDFFDGSYAERAVCVERLTEYKAAVGARKLVRLHVGDYVREEFESLVRMNVFKLNALSNGVFSPLAYNDFLCAALQSRIAGLEAGIVEARGEIAVLNTLLFFPLEFFGNRSGVYDRIVFGDLTR